MDHFDFDSAEPTAADLAAVDNEHDLIAAELLWLDAELQFADAMEAGEASQLDWQRLRSRERAVIREMLAYTQLAASVGLAFDAVVELSSRRLEAGPTVAVAA